MKLHHHLISQIIEGLRDIFIDGRYADKVIEFRFKSHPKWGARDRKLFAETTYDIVRGWRWYWHLAGLPDADCLNAQAITEPNLWLVWAAYWWKQHDQAPVYTECVSFNATKAREREKRPATHAMRASVPDWLFDLGMQEIGESWPAMMDALNKPADVFLRCNTLRTTPKELQDKLAAEDIAAELVEGLPDALRLTVRRNVFTSQCFREGLFELQDAASQHVAPFLQVAPGMRVVDACAGAGGKALHLAALMQNKGRIVALDVHDWKLAELRRRAGRNGADNIEARVIEGSKTIKRLSGSADRLLLDVPCSGLGVLRRNPDAKWKLSMEELTRLQELQRTILNDYARIVKPGGKLVYATCSVLPSENENQVQAFLSKHNAEWKLEEELKLRPDSGGFDGFYAARLVRLENAAVTAPEA